MDSSGGSRDSNRIERQDQFWYEKNNKNFLGARLTRQKAYWHKSKNHPLFARLRKMIPQ